jgi:hypothetical protein
MEFKILIVVLLLVALTWLLFRLAAALERNK